MKGKINTNIMEYMNTFGSKQFVYEDIKAIQSAIKDEYNNRKSQGIELNTKTKVVKTLINMDVVFFANKRLKKNHLTFEDIVLFKKCRTEEYIYRTGKCAYGYKELRERLGYDPNTGLENNKED